MSSEEDKRIPCKYGADCYQKNPIHHAKYKHPEKRNKSPLPNSPKRFKANFNDDQLLRDSRESKDSIDKVKPCRGDSPHSNDEDTPIRDDSQPSTDNTASETKINNDISDSEESNEESNNQDSKDALSKHNISKDSDSKDSSLKAPDSDNILQIFETLKEKKEFIENKFLVKMPDDFYTFWEFCKTLEPKKPLNALKDLGLMLVGPFDILAVNQAPKMQDTNYLRHWRYYYDPPEFQTILSSLETEYHIGYFRDTPEEVPSFVGSNTGKDCIITKMGTTIFSAVDRYLQSLNVNPFKKIFLQKIHGLMKQHTNKYNINLKDRISRNTVCKSFHTAGLVVPFNRKTQVGYRDPSVTENELKKLLDRVAHASPEDKSKVFSRLQPVLTAASIANDECDFGASLELGINIFCYGHESLDKTALDVLKISYMLLGRDAFGSIAEAHLTNRKRGEPFKIKFS